jgi:hypothetical protein
MEIHCGMSKKNGKKSSVALVMRSNELLRGRRNNFRVSRQAIQETRRSNAERLNKLLV